MDIIDRETARAKGLIRYFTGKSCKRGHIAERQVSNTACLECHRGSARRHYADNRDAILDYKKDAHVAGSRVAYSRGYYAQNREKFAEYNRFYYLNNTDSIKRQNKQYAIEHPELDVFKRLRRRCSVPPWLTDEHKRIINAFYKTARKLSRERGILYHVDHIVPLQGKNVCGLHVPWNLAIIPATENQRKRNKHESDHATVATDALCDGHQRPDGASVE